MLWFTSDLHLGHKAIIKMQRRPFNNVEEMNNTIINNINYYVMPDDTLCIIGDCSHHINKEEVSHLLKKIKCKNKYLIKGNHDKEFEDGIFEKITDYDIMNWKGNNFVLSHYPMMSWIHCRRKNYFHLHGHIHSSHEYNEENKKNNIQRYDVGVEANQYLPVSAKQIVEFFNQK